MNDPLVAGAVERNRRVGVGTAIGKVVLRAA